MSNTGDESLHTPAAGAVAALDDAELAKRIARGDRRAYELTVQRYSDSLTRYSARFVGADRAEDVVQQVLIKLYGALLAGEHIDCLKPWLYRVAHNAAIDTLRRDSVRETDELSQEPIDEYAESLESIEHRRQAEDLLALASNLPERQRHAFALREIRGLSYAEVAKALKTGTDNARKLVQLARDRVRSGLGAVLPLARLKTWLESLLGAASSTAAGSGAVVVVAGTIVAGGAFLADSGAKTDSTTPPSRTALASSNGSMISAGLGAGNGAKAPNAPAAFVALQPPGRQPLAGVAPTQPIHSGRPGSEKQAQLSQLLAAGTIPQVHPQASNTITTPPPPQLTGKQAIDAQREVIREQKRLVQARREEVGQQRDQVQQRKAVGREQKRSIRQQRRDKTLSREQKVALREQRREASHKQRQDVRELQRTVRERQQTRREQQQRVREEQAKLREKQKLYQAERQQAKEQRKQEAAQRRAEAQQRRLAAAEQRRQLREQRRLAREQRKAAKQQPDSAG